MRNWLGVLLISALLLIQGCAFKAADYNSYSFPKIQTDLKPLSEYFHKTDRPLGDASAFYPLGLPKDALAARLFLIDHAQKSLDIQYYIYENDTIGNIFSYHIYQAAERGVKVKILLDDISTTGKDRDIITLAQHPNIELKLFNPNSFRTLFRNIALLFHLQTLGKRMHNKALIADNAAAIVGGRNIGDVYYAGNEDTLFLDYDVLSIGSVVKGISKEFDVYWNSKEAVAVEKLISDNAKLDLARVKIKMARSMQRFENSYIGKELQTSGFSEAVREDTLTFVVAKRTHLFYDPPSKVVTSEDDDGSHISKQINENLTSVKKELIIISPYFIPSKTLLERFKKLKEEGIAVTVVTNSLASTDVFPVYSGYYGYIEKLLKCGVELYELKPEVLQRISKKIRLAKAPRLSLHTKLVFFDDERMAVGSANMDPRSDKLNTELVLIIESEKLTTDEKKVIEKVVNLDNFYKLTWGELPKGPYGDEIYYGPIWETRDKGELVRFYSVPEASFLKRIGAGFLRLLPIEGYL